MIPVTGANGLVGRHLVTVEEGPHQARERMARHGVPGSLIDDLPATRAVTAGVPATVSPAVEQLTGLSGRGFAQWADEHADDVR